MAGTVLVHETGPGLENVLNKIPHVLREKYCKQALRKATTIFQQQAKKNVKGLIAEGRDRWGKPKTNQLAKSIRRQLRTDGMSVIGTVLTKGETGKHAASVEYGHRAFIFGVWKDGKRVERYQFWRPAKTETRPAVDAAIVLELSKLLKNLGSLA